VIALGSLNQLGIKRVTGNLVLGNFAMNYKSIPSVAGQLLKQGLDAQMWSSVVAAQYLSLPHGTPRQEWLFPVLQVGTFPVPKSCYCVTNLYLGSNHGNEHLQ